jgi:hypothetical protein
MGKISAEHLANKGFFFYFSTMLTVIVVLNKPLTKLGFHVFMGCYLESSIKEINSKGSDVS